MKVTPSKRKIAIPPKLGIKLSYLAEELECSVATLKRNIHLPKEHRRHLAAFKISENEWRVNWEDVADWIARNRNDVEIDFSTAA